LGPRLWRDVIQIRPRWEIVRCAQTTYARASTGLHILRCRNSIVQNASRWVYTEGYNADLYSRVAVAVRHGKLVQFPHEPCRERNTIRVTATGPGLPGSGETLAWAASAHQKTKGPLGKESTVEPWQRLGTDGSCSPQTVGLKLVSTLPNLNGDMSVE
jgi:hypothetical protein